MKYVNLQRGNIETSPFLKTLCSLNFFIAIIGYPIAMALLSPWGMGVDLDSGGNRLFTWTYRGISVLVSLFALTKVYNRRIPRFDWRMTLLSVFWCLYLSRAFWDLQISPPIGPLAWNWAPGIEFQAWCYIFLFTLLPMIVTMKSVDLIDFRRVQNWIFYLGACGVACSLYANYSHAASSWAIVEGRTEASAMLNTISYGHFALCVAIVAVSRFLEKRTVFCGAICISVASLGAYTMLQAGSRGPLLALFAVVLFYAFSRSRYAVLGVLLGGVFASCVWLLMDKIVGVISSVAPVIAARLEATVVSGHTSGRDVLFSEIWQGCLENPLTGFQLDFLGYSHNACLDGFMMFGFIFGWIILILVLLGYKAAYDILKSKGAEAWVALVAIQYITACQTSWLFGANSTVQCMLVVLFIMTTKRGVGRSVNSINKVKYES